MNLAVKSRSASAFGCLCVVMLATGLAQTQPARPSAAQIADAVDALAMRALKLGVLSGLGVAVTMDGRIAYARTFGWADASARIGADDDTLWYIASTSKSFTGFGVALLAQQGALRLDAPIATVLPNARWHASVRAQSLTLAQFLSHTHDLDDRAIVLSAAYTGEIPEKDWPRLLARAQRKPVHALEYGNLGYNVAAMAIDAVRPEGWKRYLEDAVYRPAGLLNTFARISGLESRRIAKPHSLLGDATYRTETFLKTDATMNSAGGHLSTIRDLARWTIVQIDGGRIDGRQVFPTEAVTLSHRLLASHTSDQAKRFAYFDREGWGAGWDLGAYENEPMIGRFGGYHSFRSHLSFLPRRRIGVVAVANGGLGSAFSSLLAAYVYDLEAGRSSALARVNERMAELEANFRRAAAEAGADAEKLVVQRATFSAADADRLVGRFSEPDLGTIIIERQNDRLTYRWGVMHGAVRALDLFKRTAQLDVAGSDIPMEINGSQRGEITGVSIQGISFVKVPTGR